MESMTDCAFSWPISASGLVRIWDFFVLDFGDEEGGGERLGCGHTLVVIDDVAQVVPAGVMCLAHAHRVVGEVDIAVVAWGG